MRFGLQSYSIRNKISADFENTFQDIREIGYEYIELAGLYCKKADSLRDFFKSIDLSVASVMFTLEEFDKELENVAATCETLDAKYAVLPMLPPDCRGMEQTYYNAAFILESAAKHLMTKGITVAYHNHAFEFETFESGKCGYDILLSETKYLTFELDVFWIQFAGMNPAMKMKKLGNRLSMLHLKDGKDMSKSEFCEVGSGIIDIPSIVKLGIKMGIEFAFVEQDENWINDGESESVKMSLDYLNSLKI